MKGQEKVGEDFKAEVRKWAEFSHVGRSERPALEADGKWLQDWGVGNPLKTRPEASPSFTETGQKEVALQVKCS